MYADILIVGGGIGGIATARELQNMIGSTVGLSCLLFEQTDEIGGRLHSRSAFDFGAGRFCPSRHTFLHQLIQDLSLPASPYFYKLVVNCKEFHDDCLQQLLNHLPEGNFYDACTHCLGKERANKLCASFGYDTLRSCDLPFNVGLQILLSQPERDWDKDENKGQWLRLQNGFQSLASSMQNELENAGWIFHFGRRLTHVQKNENSYRVTFANQAGNAHEVLCEILILAIPMSELFHLGLASLEFIDDIQDVPLFKCLVRYETPWWSSYDLEGKCLITYERLRKIYFSLTESELFFYTDADSALFWAHKMEQGEESLMKEIQHLLTVALCTSNERIPCPLSIQYKFWSQGVTFWKKPPPFQQNNYVKLQPNLYICSDLFTEHSGWIEGSLISARKIAQQVSFHKDLALHSAARSTV